MEKALASLSLSAVLPKNPKPTGIHIGPPKKVMTNFYEIKASKESKKICVYTATFEPEIAADDRRRKYGLMSRVISQLVSKQVLAWGVFLDNQLFSTTSSGPIEIANAKWDDGAEYVITLKMSSWFDWEEAEREKEKLQVLTAVVKSCMRKLKFQQISRGSAFYDRESVEEYKELWEIYKGFHVPCRIIERGTAIQIALKNKLVAKDSVLDRFIEIKEQCTNYMSVMKSEVVGRSVRTKYGNNRYWKISDIDFTKTPLSTFEQEGKGPISFVNYFLNTYGVKISSTSQPLLVSASKQGAIYLIPELVSLAGFSSSESKFYRSELNKRLYLKNETRIAQASKLAEKIQSCPSPLGTSIITNPIVAEATLINAPEVLLGEKINADITTADREFSVKGKLYESAEYKQDKWVYVYDKNDYELACEVLQAMQKIGPSIGVDIANPVFAAFDATNLESELSGLFKSFKDNFEFSLFLMPSWFTSEQEAKCYNYVKKIACKEYPILNQVVRRKILSGTWQSKITKLLIGMCAKKGGIPWRVRTVKLDATIVIGVDICHSKEGGVNKSYLGFCATMNSAYTSLYSLAYPIAPGQELMDGLKTCVYSALMKFMERYEYRVIPKHFIVYRDGVSEGQYNAVIESEVRQITDYVANIREKLSLTAETWDPKVTYVAVSKRSNTRLFDQSVDNSSGDVCTARSGTIVSSGITGTRYSFYLISQKVTQGTAIPTHYNVLYDSSSLAPEKFHALTYRLCFLYYNWTGAIRVPAPCHYAHKLAFMAANHIEDTPSESLAVKLYYI